MPYPRRDSLRSLYGVIYKNAPLGASPSACILSALTPPQSSHCFTDLCANTNAYLRHAFQTLCHTPAETRYARLYGVTYKYAPLGASPSACILSALTPPQSSHCCVYLVLTQKRTSGTLFRLYAIPPQRLATLALRGYLQNCVSRHAQ
jgi:hypothetical protein